MFQPYFDDEGILGSKPDSGTTRWSTFVSNLDKFYLSHFVDGVQRKSVFASVQLSSFLTIIEALQPIDPQPILLENLDGFKIAIVTDEESDSFFFQRLDFFLPVFIWAFIELKKAKLDDEDIIRDMQQQANANQSVLNKLTDSPRPIPFPDATERVDIVSSLRAGTAYEYRKVNPQWKDNFARMKNRSPPSQRMLLDDVKSSSSSPGPASSTGNIKGTGRDAEYNRRRKFTQYAAHVLPNNIAFQVIWSLAMSIAC